MFLSDLYIFLGNLSIYVFPLTICLGNLSIYVFSFYCCITNYHKLKSLKKTHPFIISQFCRSEVQQARLGSLLRVSKTQSQIVSWLGFFPGNSEAEPMPRLIWVIGKMYFLLMVPMWPPLSSSQEWWVSLSHTLNLSAFLFCFQGFTWLHWVHLYNPRSLPYFKVSWLVILIISAKSLLPHNNISTRLTPGPKIMGSQISVYLSPPCGPQNSYPPYTQNTFTPLLSLQKFYHLAASRSQSKSPKSHDLNQVQVRFWVTPLSTSLEAQSFSICRPMKLGNQIICSQHRKAGEAEDNSYRHSCSTKEKLKRSHEFKTVLKSSQTNSIGF